MVQDGKLKPAAHMHCEWFTLLDFHEGDGIDAVLFNHN